MIPIIKSAKISLSYLPKIAYLRMFTTIKEEFTLSFIICYMEDFLRKVQKTGGGGSSSDVTSTFHRGVILRK